MEIHAYDEEYLYGAQKVLGDAFDYAMVTLSIAPEEFEKLFIASNSSKQFEAGNPSYLVGINGCELVHKILEECGLKIQETDDELFVDKSPEYWVGFSLAFFQWYSGKSFSKIFSFIHIADFLSMYPIYHEMDIMQFVDHINDLMENAQTKLKTLRTNIGMSQVELAREAGVPLRQIQLFEQKQRDISKTQASTLLKLSRALHCSMEDILD